MAWLQSVDVGLLRFINLQWQHPVLDEVMKFLSGNPFFFPAVAVLVFVLLTKGGLRGRVFVAVLAAVLAAGDGLVIAMLKDAIGRLRPFMTLPDVRVIVGKGSGLGSMPSGHASIWFAATMVTFVYYRRSWRFMLPLACAVSLSRVYLGVHYPSDVLAGAVLGAGYGAAGLVLLDLVWRSVGRRWFPLWWAEFPRLLWPEQARHSAVLPAAENPRAVEAQWLRVGYLLIAAMLVSRLMWLANSANELSEDEAYQWVWSKHLALSYYSKPPMIALAQRLGTALWGDTEFGVRFLSPVLGAAVLGLVLRFMARVAGARVGFFTVLALIATPLLAVGSTLLTIDPLLVFFWTLALLAGWRALQPNAPTSHWILVGLAVGLGFLSKYSALYQLLCFGLFFALWPPARAHLRRAGPYLALGLALLSTLPVVIWNASHSWITMTHLSERAGLSSPWQPTLTFFGEFLGAEAGLLNPVFFVAALWAMAAFWKRPPPATASPVLDGADAAPPQRPCRMAPLPASPDRGVVMLYLFCMAGPVFLGHMLYSLYARVLPNWIAPAVVPMFCLMMLYWDARRRAGGRAFERWFATGVTVGIVALAVLHEPRIVQKLVGRELPAALDPLRRVRAWKETAQVVQAAQERLAAEGRPVFVLTEHYGLTGQLSFYLPEAQSRVRTRPLVYCRLESRPRNQFYFWPHYRYRPARQGENAIYVTTLRGPRYPVAQWFKALLTGRPAPEPEPARAAAPPAGLLEEFTSVKDLGVHPVWRRGQVYRWLQLYECRGLR